MDSSTARQTYKLDRFVLAQLEDNYQFGVLFATTVRNSNVLLNSTFLSLYAAKNSYHRRPRRPRDGA